MNTTNRFAVESQYTTTAFKKAALIVNFDTHFESQVGVSSDLYSISSMEDYRQVENDLAVHAITSSNNQCDCLFLSEAQAKTDTVQATVDSL